MNKIAKTIGMIALVALLAVPLGIVFAGMPGNPLDAGDEAVLCPSQGRRETVFVTSGGIPLGGPLPWEPGSVLELRGDGKQVVRDAPGAINIRELGIESLAELEALFPPNPDGEFIVHCIPPLPVVIDGIRYKPEDIHLFNGQVLRFVPDDEVIYAFTTPEGLQRFVEERWGVELFGKERPLLGHIPAEAAINLEKVRPLLIWSVLYEHWNLGGRALALPHGYGFGDLRDFGFDNITSSVTTGPGWVTLYDGYMWTGNSVWLRPHTTYAFLWWFNDRASSVILW